MNTYPYIGKDKDNGNITLFTNENKGVVVKNKAFELGSYSNHWAEFAFKNITAEYLANTYGEVKSKEHAEFIVKLAEVNKVVVCDVYRYSHKFFAVIDSSLLFFNSGAIAMKDGRKQITIPLPPESNTNTPEEDFEMKQVAKNNGDNLIFGGDDKCEEWPCVNDEVLTSDGNGVVKLLPDSKGYYVVLINGEYYQYQLYELEKPKTPEEEFVDDVAEQLEFITNNALSADGSWLQDIAKAIVENKISGFEITKKPQ